MQKFVLTAELQIRGPANLADAKRRITRGLKDVGVDVKINGAARAKREVDNLARSTNNAADSAARLSQTFAISLKRFATYSIATRVVGLLTTGLGNAIDESIRFEREMVKVSQVSGKTIEQLSGLTSEIRRLATDLGVASESLVGVTRILVQAGLSADETKIALEALAKSELAPTFDDITQTAEGAIAIFNQFGEGAEALEGQLGAINAVSGKFAVESGDLIAAVRRVGGVFKSAGGDLNELLGLFTSIRATTRESGESIATGLRTIFVRIQRPRTLAFLEQMGVKLTDMEGKFVGPLEAVKRMNKEFSNLEQGDPRFIKIAEEIAGFRQIGKVIPLLQQFEVAQQAVQVAQEGQNSLTKNAEEAQASLQVRMTKLKEEFLSFVDEVYKSPVFQSLVNQSLQLASALVGIGSAIKDILPLIGVLAGVKLLRSAGSFVGNVGRNLASPRQFNQGGKISKSDGKYYRTEGSSDDTLIHAQSGEYVIKKSSASKIGQGTLDFINKYGDIPAYQSGGEVTLPQINFTGAQGLKTLRKSFNKQKNWSEEDFLSIDYKTIEVDPFATTDKLSLKAYLRSKSSGADKTGNSSNKKGGEAFERIVAKRFGVKPRPGADDFLDFAYGEAKSDADFGRTIGKNTKAYSTLLSKSINSFRSSLSKFTPEIDHYKPTDREITLFIDKYRNWNSARYRKELEKGKIGKSSISGLNRYLKKTGKNQGGYLNKNDGLSYKINGSSDDTLIHAQTGEYVISKKSSEKLGVNFLDHINKYGQIPQFNKGGKVGSKQQVIKSSFDRDEDTSVLGSISEAETVMQEFLGSMKKWGKMFQSLAKQSVNDISKTDPGLEGIAYPEGGIGVAVGGTNRFTVEHETAHQVDRTMGQKAPSLDFEPSQYASGQEGTFQNAITEKLKPVLRRQLQKEKASEEEIAYRLENEEIFADLMAKTVPVARAILVHTTNAEKGLEQLAKLIERDGSISGFAGLTAEQVKRVPKKKSFKKPSYFYSGGKVKASGIDTTGTIFKPRNRDTEPAMLAKGEWVVNNIGVGLLGADNLDRANKGKKPLYAYKGGYVSNGLKYLATGNKEAIKSSYQRDYVSYPEGISGLSDVIDDVVRTISQLNPSLAGFLKKVRVVSKEEIDENTLNLKTNSGDTVRDNIGNGNGNGAIAFHDGRIYLGGRSGKATAIHEVGHQVDHALGAVNITKQPSLVPGTFQYNLSEKVKERFKSQGLAKDKYRAGNEEIFADIFSKAPPEIRSILAFTIDAKEGAQLLARAMKQYAGEIDGLADLEPSDFIPEYGSFNGGNKKSRPVVPPVNSPVYPKRVNINGPSIGDLPIIEDNLDKVSPEKSKITNNFATKAIGLFSGFSVISTVFDSMAESGSKLANILDTLESAVFTSVASIGAFVQILKVAKEKGANFQSKRSGDRKFKQDKIDIEEARQAIIIRDDASKRAESFGAKKELFGEKVQKANAVKEKFTIEKAELEQEIKISSKFFEDQKAQDKDLNSQIMRDYLADLEKDKARLSELSKKIDGVNRSIVNHTTKLENYDQKFKEQLSIANNANDIAKQKLSSISQENFTPLASNTVSSRFGIRNRIQTGKARVGNAARKHLPTFSKGVGGTLNTVRHSLQTGASLVSGVKNIPSAAKALVGKMGGLTGILGGASAGIIALTQATASVATYFEGEYLEAAKKSLEDGDYIGFRKNSALADGQAKNAGVARGAGNGALIGGSIGATVGILGGPAGVAIGGAIGSALGAGVGAVLGSETGRDFEFEKGLETKIIEDATKKAADALNDFSKGTISVTQLIKQQSASIKARDEALINSLSIGLDERLENVDQRSTFGKATDYIENAGSYILSSIKTVFTKDFWYSVGSVIKDAAFALYDALEEPILYFQRFNPFAGEEGRKQASERLAAIKAAQEQKTQAARNAAFNLTNEEKKSIADNAIESRSIKSKSLEAIENNKSLTREEKDSAKKTILDSVDKDFDRKIELQKQKTGPSAGSERITAQIIEELNKQRKKTIDSLVNVEKGHKQLRGIRDKIISVEAASLKATSALNNSTVALKNIIGLTSGTISKLDADIATIEGSKTIVGNSKESNASIDRVSSKIIEDFNLQGTDIGEEILKGFKIQKDSNILSDLFTDIISSVQVSGVGPDQREASLFQEIGKEIEKRGLTESDAAKDLLKIAQSAINLKPGENFDNETLSAFSEKVNQEFKKVSDARSKTSIAAIALDQEFTKARLENIKKTIEAENNLAQVRLNSSKLFQEGSKVIEEFGGRKAPSDTQFALGRQNILNKEAGVSTINDPSQISGNINEIINSIAKEQKLIDSGTLNQEDRAVSQDRVNDLNKALENQASTIRDTIAAKKEEIQLIDRKNQLEKESINSLIKGDIQDFFKKQAAKGATAAVASGDTRLTNLFGAEAIGNSLDDLQRQKDAGVKSVFGQDINSVIQSGTSIGLQKRGLNLAEAEAASRVNAGTTEEQEVKRAEIRQLGQDLQQLSFAQVNSASIQVSSAKINAETIQIEFSKELQRQQAKVNQDRTTTSPSDRRVNTPVEEARATSRANTTAGDGRSTGLPSGAEPSSSNDSSIKTSYFSKEDLKNFDKFLQATQKLSAAVEQLANSKINVSIAPVNVNLNVTGPNMLAYITKEARNAVADEVRDQIRKLKNGV